MHVALVCDEYPPAPHGGIGSFTADLAAGLIGAGHSVTVAGISATLQIPSLREEEANGVRIYRIPRAPSWLRHRIGGIWERRTLRRVLRMAHARQALDVIECPDFQGWITRGGLGAPLVVRIHGSNLFFDAELQRHQNRGDYASERACLASADHLISVSAYAARRTLEEARLEKPFEVIPCAVDSVQFAPDPSIPTEPGLILYVNTLNPKKGIEQLLEAANLLLPRRKEARLVVVGGDTQYHLKGGYLEMLKDKVAPELRGRVEFAGRIPRTEVAQWLRRAAVCCYPSHMETFGIAVIEAMSTGKPVIYAKRGPGPEVIEDGVSGLLCDPLNPADIVLKIERVLDSPDFARKLGENARARVLERFEKSRWIERNIALYERIARVN